MDEIEGSEPMREEEIERIHAEWENEFQGPENHGRIIVAPPGGKFDILGSKPVDMDYQAGWDQQTAFALGGFGMTKPAAGMVDDSSYAVLYATLKQLHLLTLAPKCQRFAQALTRKVAPFFGDDLIVEIKTQRIDDHEITDRKLQMLIGAKAITLNELRQELDMPTVEEDWGNERAGAEQQQGQPGGMPGMPGGEQPQPGQEEGGGMPEPPSLEGEEDDSGGMPEPPEITKSRPKPGDLGEGSLGPRGKSLNGHVGKNRLRAKYGHLANGRK